MGFVRCYFLDENGHIIGAENFEAETVDAAISFGTELAEKRERCDSIEIWRGAERLHPAPTSTVASDRHAVAG
ncbi:MAG TPA: hypothetical protein VJS41_09050 [Stellaceae bacterium]|nr:hypothetical protein [Stellaceae bacterium]